MSLEARYCIFRGEASREGVTEFAREEKKGYTVITLSTISGHKNRSAWKVDGVGHYACIERARERESAAGRTYFIGQNTENKFAF